MKRRTKLNHDVLRIPNRPVIVFVTACTKNRAPYLACDEAHRSLRSAWKAASAWLVGRYTVMPDHIHFFVSPSDMDEPLERWMSYWRRLFGQLHPDKNCRWQSEFWDTRLRQAASYDDKWIYIRENPVRAGLASTAEEWPYQGELNVLAQ